MPDNQDITQNPLEAYASRQKKQPITTTKKAADKSTVHEGENPLESFFKKKSGIGDGGTQQQKPSEKTSTTTEQGIGFDPYKGVIKKEEDTEMVVPYSTPFKKVPLTPQERLVASNKNIQTRHSVNTQAIQDWNTTFGTNMNPNEILSDADKSAAFYNDLVKEDKALYTKQQFNPALMGMTPQEIELEKKEDVFGQLGVKKQKFIDTKQYIPLLEEHIANLSVTEGITKGLTDNQVTVNLFKRLDPKGYNKHVANIDKTVSDVVTSFQMMPIVDDISGHLELLNTDKGKYDLMRNQAKQSVANELFTVGSINGDKKLIDKSKEVSATIQDDDEIYAKYPSLNTSRIANEIGTELAIKLGQLKGSEAEGIENIAAKFQGGYVKEDIEKSDTFKKYLNNPKTHDAALEVLHNVGLVPNSQYFGGVLDNLFKPVKDLFYSLGDLSGIVTKGDRIAETKKEELFPDEPQNLKNYVSKIRGAINTTSYLVGMIPLAAVGGEAGEAMNLGDIAIGQKVIKGSEVLGNAVSLGIPSMHQNLKDVDQYTDNTAVKAMYATIGAMINTVGGEFLPVSKLSKFGLEKDALKLAQTITDKEVTEKGVAQVLNDFKPKFISASKKYGVNVGGGAVTMAYFTFANGINKMVFGGGGNMEDLTNETGQAFVSGLLGMSVIGGFGAAKDMKNEKSSSFKNNIYDLAAKHDATRDMLDKSYREGKFTVEEYNQKVQVLNTAVAAKNQLDRTQQDHDIKLSSNQRSVFVANRTAEAVLTKQLESPTITPELKSKYEGQIKRLAEQRENIIQGLKFDDNLVPHEKLFEAEKNYNKALEYFNSGTVDSDK